MRKRPVLPMILRRAVKDVRIGRYIFPAGTIIEVHVLAMNTHPLYWDRPDDFLPVRSNSLTHPHAHVHLFKLVEYFGTDEQMAFLKSFRAQWSVQYREKYIVLHA